MKYAPLFLMLLLATCPACHKKTKVDSTWTCSECSCHEGSSCGCGPGKECQCKNGRCGCH